MLFMDGKYDKDFIFDNSVEVTGQINGKVTLEQGGKLSLRGQINGNVVIREGSEMFLHGTVNGDVLNDGGLLHVFGVINGRLFRERGKTLIQDFAIINEK